MAFRGFGDISDILRQGYQDKIALDREQRASDLQQLQMTQMAQEGAARGLYANNPEMRARLGVSNLAYVDPRDLQQPGSVYSNPRDYGAPQPMAGPNGTLVPQQAPQAPVISGGYRFPTPQQQMVQPMPQPGPFRSGYVMPTEVPASTGPNQPGPWAQTITQAPTEEVHPELAKARQTFTAQTLDFLKKQFGDDAVDERGNVRPDLATIVEKIQAKQAELESLAQQNQLKYGTTLTKAELEAKEKARIAEEERRVKESIAAQGNQTSRANTKDRTKTALEVARIQAASRGKGGAGNKEQQAGIPGLSAINPVLNAEYIQRQKEKEILLKNYQAGKAAEIEGRLEQIRQEAAGLLTGSGRMKTNSLNSSPAGSAVNQNLASAKKAIVKRQYSKSANKTRLIYSDGSTDIVDGKQ